MHDHMTHTTPPLLTNDDIDDMREAAFAAGWLEGVKASRDVGGISRLPAAWQAAIARDEFSKWDGR